MILRSLTRGTVIPRITKSDLSQAQFAVPSLKEQEEIVRSHSQLQALRTAIANFQRELALNPGRASAIRGQVDGMLETIGGLTEADKVMSLAREGESETLEFKESFSLDVRKGTKEKYIELSALKTIVAFLNTNGGVLLIGVADSGDIPGVRCEVEKFHKSTDAFLLHFKNQLKQRVGEQNYPYINHRLVGLGNANVLMVDCKPATSPCYLDGKEFYVRTNPATDKLEGPKLVEYVQNHFKK
ncbi:MULTISPECIES: RNA-binding domain-containing protein [unclassified Marinimicrobium]|uniref:RNA-binding domain-containing protein n=1 Tax=unclassified Marinimicrobium TaxID=2632100 RepID=UPI0030DCA6B4